jgi:hypothetical protein
MQEPITLHKISQLLALIRTKTILTERKVFFTWTKLSITSDHLAVQLCSDFPGDVVQVVVCLLNKCKTLSSNPSIAKN